MLFLIGLKHCLHYVARCGRLRAMLFLIGLKPQGSQKPPPPCLRAVLF